jgi:hypothetical protein
MARGSIVPGVRGHNPGLFEMELPLGLLLMANCGMTQEDVSDLLDSEVDRTEGPITRKQSMTAAHESVPTVCYKLWPLTFYLLKHYRSGTERVLLTAAIGTRGLRSLLMNLARQHPCRPKVYGGMSHVQ